MSDLHPESVFTCLGLIGGEVAFRCAALLVARCIEARR
jgi:hypothetical protein